MNIPGMPQVKFNRNGYEIRTDILGMAKDFVSQDFQVRWNGWEMSAMRDEKTGQIVSTVNMPEYPQLDKVLDTAQRMYDFVNAGKSIT